MSVKSLIKVPLVLLENIIFWLFPRLRGFIEQHLFNPYAFNEKHAAYSKTQFEEFLKRIGGVEKIQNKDILELGPGASVGFGLLALKSGAKKYYAIESISHAFVTPSQMESYAHLLDGDISLIKKFFIFDNGGCSYNKNLIEFIEVGQDASYFLPDASVDIIYSCAVLEHVHNLNLCFSEMTRILKPGGIMNHQVDLRDHIFSQKSLYFLSLSDTWFRTLFQHTGEYVNRKRLSYYKKLIAKFNLQAKVIEVNSLYQGSLHKDLLSKYSEDDLRSLALNLLIIKTPCAE